MTSYRAQIFVARCPGPRRRPRLKTEGLTEGAGLWYDATVRAKPKLHPYSIFRGSSFFAASHLKFRRAQNRAPSASDNGPRVCAARLRAGATCAAAIDAATAGPGPHVECLHSIRGGAKGNRGRAGPYPETAPVWSGFRGLARTVHALRNAGHFGSRTARPCSRRGIGGELCSSPARVLGAGVIFERTVLVQQ